MNKQELFELFYVFEFGKDPVSLGLYLDLSTALKVMRFNFQFDDDKLHYYIVKRLAFGEDFVKSHFGVK